MGVVGDDSPLMGEVGVVGEVGVLMMGKTSQLVHEHTLVFIMSIQE